MASIAAACRLTARAAHRQLSQHSRRGFQTGRVSLAASNFNMPALSPTMTEGSIASWKVKEGESFSAGDVLLEIETDKAQMDVEAQDDGILAKITVGDGSKAVQVGTRIAVMAEPGDDLSSLEIPPEDNPKAASGQSSEAAKPAPTPSPPKPSAKAPGAAKSSGKAQKQTYPLYPAVQHLLYENGLTKEDADNIPASGPNGRLLKGDVLAYMGRINESYSAEQSKRISKLGHLDLSNIKVKPTEKPAAKAAAAETTPVVEEEVDTELALAVSFASVLACQKRIQDNLGVHLPLSTFINRAVYLANEDLPRSKTAKATADELFDAVLGLDKVNVTGRGQLVPQVVALPPTGLLAAAPAAKISKPDILDELVGQTARREVSPLEALGVTDTAAPINVFSVTVPKGDEQRAQVFLERVKTVLEGEPGRLVL